MRKFFLALILLLPLTAAGCTSGEEPLVPELKGRWAAPNAVKLRYALLADRLANPPPPPAVTDSCKTEYVTFGQHSITLYANAMVNPLFVIKDFKRDGARLILKGQAPLAAGGEPMTIELILRNGEVRFDDIVDKRGRSVRYDRIENEQARRVNVTTVGDLFRLVLDLKPCRA